MRKNIFDILSEHLNIRSELERIIALFGTDLYTDGMLDYTPENLVDEHVFFDWKHRNRCICIADMRSRLNIFSRLDKKSVTIEVTLNHIEYFLNIIYLADKYVYENCLGYHNELGMLRDNITFLLDSLNYQAKVFPKDDRVILYEKSAQVTAVAEIVDTTTAISILSYHHARLKGNLTEKKNILLELGAQLEPRRGELDRLNKQLSSDIFFVLNNLNIRHNNKATGTHYKKFVDEMVDNTLEEWYDELYQLILLAFLTLDNIERASKIATLKATM